MCLLDPQQVVQISEELWLEGLLGTSELMIPKRENICKKITKSQHINNYMCKNKRKWKRNNKKD